MTTRAQKIREVARQALYRTPNDQECEVPIMVATLREVVNQLQKYGTIDVIEIGQLCEEIENL
jgi:hypothetical protein